MKKWMMKFETAIASLALIMATVNVNSACVHYIYQPPVPDSAKKLRRF